MKTRANINNFLVMLVFSLGTLCTAATGGTIYVDDDATGANDGSDWDNAYKYLQDALAGASSGDEIRVAEGVYKPDQGAGVTSGERMATFQLISGLAIYGSIGGGESILSGDIGTAGDSSDNSYHVVNGSWTDETAVLDGFTISGGNADQERISMEEAFGGGMCNLYYGSPTVMNCTFIGNSARLRGGGMCNGESSPTVTNCKFSGNSAGDGGGGMLNGHYSSTTVTNCTFSGNSAYCGGGMRNLSDSNPTVTNCTFSENSGGDRGGGMYNYRSSPTVTNCTFTGNSAYYDGGGIWNSFSKLTVTNCTFSGNSAVRWGGGMWNSGVSLILTNCTFSCNSAGECGGGMWNHYNTTATVTNCILWGDTAGTAGGEIALRSTSFPSTLTISYSDVQGGAAGVYVESGCTLTWGDGNIDADPLFADADLRLSAGSPCINAGSNAALPPDTADLDGDGDTTEPIPLDLDGNARISNDIVDMGAYEGEGEGPSVITVEIDIKPGSYPNAINLGSQGVIPVAILSSSGFDATTVDPDTVELSGAGVAVRGKADKYMAHEEDVNGDGLLDLVCKVETDNLDPETFQYGFMDLTGETYDGVPIKGEDEIIIVPPEE